MARTRAKAKAATPPEPSWSEVLEGLRSFAAENRARLDGEELGVRLGHATQAQRDLVRHILDGAFVPGAVPVMAEGRLH